MRSASTTRAGALLTAPLLGAGLAPPRRSSPSRARGRSSTSVSRVGIALAVPVHGAFAGARHPGGAGPPRLHPRAAAGDRRQHRRDARGRRRRAALASDAARSGTALIIAGIAAAATGSGLAGLGAAGKRDRDRDRRRAALRRIRRSCAHSVVFLAQNGPSLSHKRCLNKVRTWQSLPVVTPMA